MDKKTYDRLFQHNFGPPLKTRKSYSNHSRGRPQNPLIFKRSSRVHRHRGDQNLGPNPVRARAIRQGAPEDSRGPAQEPAPRPRGHDRVRGQDRALPAPRNRHRRPSNDIKRHGKQALSKEYFLVLKTEHQYNAYMMTAGPFIGPGVVWAKHQEDHDQIYLGKSSWAFLQ